MSRTADQNWVRERNLSIIMHKLWEVNEPIKRSRLTQISGLNKSTVGSLLNELHSLGFVRWVGYADSVEVGRPSSLVDINPDGGRIIGIEIGKDFIALVLANLKAQVLSTVKATRSRDTNQHLNDATPENVIKETERLIADVLLELKKDKQPALLGIGIGIPAMIDINTKFVLDSRVMNWSMVEIEKRLAKRFKVPVVIGNDADVAALGEWMFGVGKNLSNFVYISSNVGIGGGLVLDGKVYQGSNGFAGEIGHMVIDKDGPICDCGNRGCLEALIRPLVLIEHCKQAAKEGSTPVLEQICEGKFDNIDIEKIFQAYKLGDPHLINYIKQVADYFSSGIVNIINILDPQLIVIGGSLSLAGTSFLNLVEEEVNRRTLSKFRKRTRICYSINAFNATAAGGVALILSMAFNNPANWK